MVLCINLKERGCLMVEQGAPGIILDLKVGRGSRHRPPHTVSAGCTVLHVCASPIINSCWQDLGHLLETRTDNYAGWGWIFLTNLNHLLSLQSFSHKSCQPNLQAPVGKQAQAAEPSERQRCQIGEKNALWDFLKCFSQLARRNALRVGRIQKLRVSLFLHFTLSI